MQNHCFIRKHFVARRVAKYKYIHVDLYECSIAQFVYVCACVRARFYQFYTFKLNRTPSAAKKSKHRHYSFCTFFTTTQVLVTNFFWFWIKFKQVPTRIRKSFCPITRFYFQKCIHIITIIKNNLFIINDYV